MSSWKWLYHLVADLSRDGKAEGDGVCAAPLLAAGLTSPASASLSRQQQVAPAERGGRSVLLPRSREQPHPASRTPRPAVSPPRRSESRLSGLPLSSRPALECQLLPEATASLINTSVVLPFQFSNNNWVTILYIKFPLLIELVWPDSCLGPGIV